MNSKPLQASQLIAFEGNGESLQFVLDKVKLRSILKTATDKRILLISICGPSRLGRSSLLNFLMRFLKAKEQNEDDTLGWDKPDDSLEGFEWSHGDETCTSGIWITTEPIMLTDSDGEVFAVYLVDTQGVLDEYSSSAATSFILGLCLQLSTTTIFTTAYELQEDKIIALANAVSLIENRLTGCQHLYLVIKDWAGTEEFQIGEKGGQMYKAKRLGILQHHTETSKKARQQLGSVKQIDGFLLPTPGPNVRQADYNGNIAKLPPRYTNALEMLLLCIFNEDNLPSLNLCRNAKEVIGLVEQFVVKQNAAAFAPKPEDTCQNDPRESAPSPCLAAVISVEDQIKDLCTEIIHNHKVQLAAGIKETKNQFMDPTLLATLHEELKNAAIMQYVNSNIQANFSIQMQYKDKLNNALEEVYDMCAKPNEVVRNGFIKKWDHALATCIECYQDQTEALFKPKQLTMSKAKLNNEICKRETLETFQKLVDKTDVELLVEYQDILCTKLDAIFKNEQEKFDSRKKTGIKSEFEACKNVSEEQYTTKMKKCTSKSPVWSEEKLKEFHVTTCKNVLREADLPADDDDNSYKQLLTEFLDEKLENVLAKNLIKRNKFFSDEDSPMGVTVGSYKANMAQLLNGTACLSFESFKENAHNFKTSALKNLNKKIKNFDEELAAEISRDLETKLNEIHQIELEKFTAQKKTEKNFEKKKSILKSGVVTYQLKMQTQLSDRISTDEDVEKLHDESVQQTMKELASSSDLVDEEFKATLLQELENTLVKFKEMASNHAKTVQSEADKLVKILALSYNDECLKTAWNNTTDLERFHETQMCSLVNEFQRRCTIKEESYTKPYTDKLNAQMVKFFNQHIPSLKLKLEQEDILIQGNIIKVTESYKNEMEKHFKKTAFMKPADFRLLHEDLTNQTLTKLKIVSHKDQQLIKEALLPQYDKYNDRNTMNIPGNAAIGIDLGTTNSCVAVYHNGEVKVILSEFGTNTIPSYVAFTPTGELIGDAAKNQAHENPVETLFDVKRLIGRQFDDPLVQNDIKLWPFKVVQKAGSDIPMVMANGIAREPEFISAKILQHIKNLAEKHLQVPKIDKAVITVPAYFNDGQRQATIDAGEIAGFKVLQILNEPTAAAMAYYLHQTGSYASGKARSNILVYDLGGGTFDVSILTIDGGGIQVRAVDGDTHLGGEDFDHNLVKFCVKNFKAQYGIDLAQGRGSTNLVESVKAARQLRRLRNECERRKKDLSTSASVTVVLDAITQSLDLNVSVTRQDFEKMNMPMFQKTIQIVENALKESKLKKDEIDEIVLVGGSSRIPKIQELLKEFFDGKQLCVSLNPDEAVAIGAAVLAAKLNGLQEQKLRNISLQDVSPLSLGIEVVGGSLSVILPRNTPLPVKKTKDSYTTTSDDQTAVTIYIYEGEELLVAKKNHLLGTFRLENIPPNRKGIEKIDVTMEINEQGILHVTACCVSTGKSNDIEIKEDKGRLTKEHISSLRMELA